MDVLEVITWVLFCTGCGTDSDLPETSPAQARSTAEQRGWLVTADATWCPSCLCRPADAHRIDALAVSA